MDRRSWPWKKKSSDKLAAEKAIAILDSTDGSLPSGGSQADKDNNKKPNYVQISMETYTHLTGLENRVKTNEKQAKIYEEQSKIYEEQLHSMEEEINELNEKLSSATSEITTKEELVNQHAKVAEDAVSGWEKAEAEALTLKNHLESITLAKLTVDEKAAHLDDALKECMRQIRNLKEENEQKLQQVTLAKNKQYDKMKHDLETKIAYMDQDLMRAEAENSAISRSLQDRSNMLIKVSEEKSRAEADIELLKSNVESCEREINSLKYELHIVSKEMEIRNEEKNMCVKTADAANKQQMESVKKIAKLEAECQRLRGLVRKKLPGPAALAQMKLEVESLGRRSPMRPSSPQFSSSLQMLSVPEISLDGAQKFQKENEFLTERLLCMEEETKMLKEALAKRNSELQTSRSMYAMTTNKLQSLEAQVHAFNLPKGFPKNLPNMTYLSEDGNDDTISCAESWNSSLISEVSHIKERNKEKSVKSENGSHLELMDDFEEMEKLAHNGSGANNQPNKTMTSNTKHDAESPLRKLQSRISRVLESVSDDSDVVKILENINLIVQDVKNSVNCVFEEKHCSNGAEKGICQHENGTISGKNEKISHELETSLSQIHNFILSLGKEARMVHGSEDGNGMSHKVERLSAVFNRVLCNEITLDYFLFALSDVIAKASELKFDFSGYKLNESEVNSPTCIDKVALPENKPPQEENYSNGCGHISDSCSNPEVPQEANILSGFEPGSFRCSVEEFELLKSEKDSMERVIFRCSQDLEMAKSELKDMEKQLSEVKSELTSSQKMNSLAETQLKCMAESYKSLEKRSEELEDQVNVLHEKMECLKNELETEKTSHQDALARCRVLEEQLQRNEDCSVCSTSAAEVAEKAKQEKELEAATEKLAACQETIFLLGKQLKSMRPLPELNSELCPESGAHNEDGPTTRSINLKHMDQVEMDTATSPVDLYNASFTPSDAEKNNTRSSFTPSKTPTHRHTKSGSSTASSTPTPEKHLHGFSRFFSTKGKTRY